MLWYSDSSGNIRSINLATSTADPKISSGKRVGANPGADRHFSIDPARNLLYVSTTDNSVQIVNSIYCADLAGNKSAITTVIVTRN